MNPVIIALALDLSGSIVSLQDTTAPGAIAEVRFENRPVNGQHETGDYMLTLRDMVVGLRFVFNAGMAGADAVEVTPPDGVICKPTSRRLELLEGSEGVIILYPWEGM